MQYKPKFFYISKINLLHQLKYRCKDELKSNSTLFF